MRKMSYTSGSDGEKVELRESNNMVVVRTMKGKTLHDSIQSQGSRQSISKFQVKQKIPRANVTILAVKKTHKDPLRVRNEARKNLKQENNIRFAGRVLVDKGTSQPVIYTENIFVRFKPNTEKKFIQKILKDFKLKIKDEVKYAPNAYFVEAPEGTGMEIFNICKSILKKREVEYCEPELIRKAGKRKLPMPPSIYFRQWHLGSTRIGKRTIRASAQVAQAHGITQGRSITIAVIDDGVDIHHIEFNIKGKIKAPRDASYRNSDPTPKLPDDNHGTACAGVACASGIHKACGVAPASRLLPIRNVSELGSKDEADSIFWAVEHGADIISCSWGPDDGNWWNPKDRLHKTRQPIAALTSDALHYAATHGRKGRGCIILFAAGNGNENADLDKYVSHPDVLAVAACNDRSSKSVYSDFGDCIWVCFPSNDFELKRPHHNRPLTKGIWTTDRSGYVGEKRKGLADYISDFGGTSSACPGAAGVCALILSANPGLSRQEVKDILKLTADKIDIVQGNYNDKGHSKWYGYGRVNALKAVELALLLKRNPG